MAAFVAIVLLGSIVCCSACQDAAFGDSTRSTNAIMRTAPCDKWRALALDVGCVASDCAIAAACAAEARAFIDCTAEDISQCLCEADDGQLNCEGAYKPSEGAARCSAEQRKLDACLDRQD